MSIKAFSLRRSYSHAKSEMRPQTAKATRGRVIFLEIQFAASGKRSPKVAAPQSGFTLLYQINTPLYNAKSGNLLVKFLCAAADYVAIPEKHLLLIRLKTFDT